MNNISLMIDATSPPKSWSEFCAKCGPYGIALDGFVADSSCRDLAIPAANFNHHENCDRLATRATSAQVLLAIRLGLFDCFRQDGVPTARVWVNDCDEDVCLSFFLLDHAPLAQQVLNPKLNRLVGVAEILDATAGMMPISFDLPIIRQLTWIFSPYREFRMNGGLDRRDAGEFGLVINEVCRRIEDHLFRDGKEQAPAIKYTRLGGGQGWAMIREEEPQGRQGALADGIRAFVSVRERKDGAWAYSIGRSSDHINFSVPFFLNLFNQVEASLRGVQPDELVHRWGGGSTIGGSPRVPGSLIDPSRLERIINLVIDSYRLRNWPVASEAEVSYIIDNSM